ncbi:MAG: M56 family metallopeptidase [Clostridiales bacterium]|nr:M56 family metallopeptidase [Clostridiales bacterium]
MNTLFIRLLNLSIAATWIILAVILIRAFSKKAPKWFPCILWALVGIRLLCPVTIPSPLSLVPREEVIPINITEEKEPEVDSEMPVIAYTADPELGNVDHENTVVHSGNIVREAAPQMTFTESNTKTVSSESRGMTLIQIITIASYVWISGLALMLGYALFSYIRLKRSLTASIPVKDGVLACDEVRSPFILGVFRPKIYVPSSIKEDALKHVLAHEESHIKRHDHWWKPLGFLILSVYWFHPLCWVSYVLLCRDIEMACDEKVIRMMKKEEAASYSQTLLDLSTRKTAIAACPIAFGEVGVKQRVKNVLNYKKPGFWVIVGVIVVSVAVSVLFLTKPMKKKEVSNDETEATEENATGDIPDSQTTTPSISDESNPSEPDTTTDSSSVQDSSSTEEPKTTAAPEVTEGIPGSRVAFIPDYDYEDELKMEKEAVNADQLSLSHKRSFPMYRFDTKEELDTFIQKYSDGMSLDKGGNGYPSFTELTSEEAGYDSKFFEKNSILAVYDFTDYLDYKDYLSGQGINDQGVYQLTVSLKGPWPLDESRHTQAAFFILYDVADEELAKASSLDAVSYWGDDYYAYIMMRNSVLEMDRELPEGKIWNEKTLLFDHAETVGFGYEYYYGPKTDMLSNNIKYIFDNLNILDEYFHIPCREKTCNDFYLMYRMENNYRLYQFFSYPANGCTRPVGYGLVVGKVHTSSDFAGLKRGDSIDDVIKIDDVASLYKEYFLDHLHYDTDRAKTEEADGNSICSLHYLDDGLIKIEYTMKEEGKLIIKNIEYYSNWVIEDSEGREVEYQIFDIDLPK